MDRSCWKSVLLVWISLTAMLCAQQNPPIMYAPKPEPAKPAAPQPAPPPAAKPEAPKPGAPPQAKPPAAPAAQSGPVATPAAPAPGPLALTDSGGFLLDNVSLTEFIDILARRMKINYILDPKVNGRVTIHTYGEVKPTDLMPLMETVLRVNGAAMVKVGDLYRIVPVNMVDKLPIPPQVNAKDLPDDERIVMNLVFLKYVTVADMSKLLEPFLGEGARMASYDPANLLIMMDNSRNMRRTMELIALFDSDSFASQRVRSFETKYGRPSDIVKELESVFKAFALSDKNAAVKFIAVDRINTVLAVASNPGAFSEVEKWMQKLDVPVKITSGAVDNYVYRLKYGRAETVAMAIMALYSGNPFAMMGMMGMMGMGMGGMGYGGMGMGGMGGMYGGMGGMGGMGMGGMGGMGYGGMGGMYGGMGAMGYGGMGAMGYGAPYGTFAPAVATPPMATTTAGQQAVTGVTPGTPAPDQTGSYLNAYGMPVTTGRIPHVIPNPFDNTLLIQATPQEWEQIRNLLTQLDIPPRQVLIEAKIYEVDLSGALSAGVDSYLQRVNSASSAVPTAPSGASRLPLAANAGGIASLTTGLLVGHSRELLAVVTAQEQQSKARVISAPSVIATDSIVASLQVGQDVPTLTSQAVAPGVQQSGSSLFTNTVGSRSTGVNLNILAMVNSSGVVTLVINQDVSAPQATTTSSIQSPTFSHKSVQTQVTVQDGDTIAIGGIIQESSTEASGGIPLLHRIPVLGAAFGSKSYSSARTELIIFLTPRVIYDTNQIAEASDELKAKVRRLQKMMKE